MPIKTLQEKFVHELGDIYDAEHRFLEAQQKMQSQATAPDVQAVFEKHIPETEQQIKNLEQVFELLGEKPNRISCEGAAGIVSEGNKLLKETSDVPELADLAMAGANAKVEHYEISCYRGLITAATQMGQTEIVQLLQQNLQQEESTAQTIETAMPQLLQQAMDSAAGAAAAA